MEKLPMCRICLAEDVRMYVVVNKKLHELYERLTGDPFVTKDRRPMLACFICCTKLKQCCQLQRKCLEAEDLLTQMMNEDYELNPFTNQDRFGCVNELTQSPMVHVSIDDECQTECVAIKEKLPAVCERLDDVIEPKEECHSDDLEQEILYNSYSDTENKPAQQSESDSEDDRLLKEIKTEVEEEQEVSSKKRRDSDTTRAAAATKENLHIRGKLHEDIFTENRKIKTYKAKTRVTQNTVNCTSKLKPKFEETLTNTTPRGNISVNDTSLDENDISYMYKHTGGVPHKCDIGQYSCNNKEPFLKHIGLHTGEKSFKCEECQRCFGDKTRLTRHIRTHTGNKPHKCKECQRCFTQKGHLETHIRTHTGEKPYKCEECQRCFREKVHLTRHIRTHTGNKPYKCDKCQLRFNVQSNLVRHIRTHTGEKPYKCDECQRCFRAKGNLRNHILKHSGVKPYKCEECQRCFSDKVNLKTHIRTHTGEKPYKCEECQRCFRVKTNLTKHIGTHTGEYPFKCEFCHSSFRQKGSLTKHILTHTK
ncbi:hypothetical protein PYW07_012915 [Mythimna separata]|uniref:Uncharacterized protein n=1 Tax=Mythimna separata TaxID=271217 RepID=A0AAD8DLR2_MYTSE|nr:hypothetical protein PYW07_012915 [Mythimna separata]